RDRINYTEEEKLRLARKYGLTAKDMRDIAEEESLQAVGKDTEPDYFEYMEQKDDEDVIRHGYMKESELTDSEKTDDEE
uniref:hypothetical protein n=1 Tax=Prevotella sp. TaxID=59823 RepID=UPI003FF04ABF